MGRLQDMVKTAKILIVQLFDVLAWWARSGLMDVVRPSDNSSPGSIPIGMGDQPSGVALFAKHHDCFI